MHTDMCMHDLHVDTIYLQEYRVGIPYYEYYSHIAVIHIQYNCGDNNCYHFLPFMTVRCTIVHAQILLG